MAHGIFIPVAIVGQHLAKPSTAYQLGSSEKTVRNNVSAILVKPRVADRAQAILVAQHASPGLADHQRETRH